MHSSWMLARLDDQTRSRHAEADDDRLSLINAPATVDSYLRFLVRVYGFEHPVESALRRLDDALDVRARTTIELLESDLRALGVTDLTALPRCRRVFPFQDPVDALGWIYVLERNAMLHGILRRHLHVRMRGPLADASAYLGAHESVMGSRLRELGDCLDRFARSPAIADQIVSAAHTAFRCQRRWYTEAVLTSARVA